MKKAILYFVVGFFALGIIGSFLPEEAKKDEVKVAIKKEIKQEPIKVTYNEAHGALVKSFGYSLQAGMICDNLQLRLDTKEKIEKKIGTTTTQSIYGDDYMIGVNSALKDDEQGTLCEQAWLHFGCDGDIEAKLLQGNPFKLQNPLLCEY